MKPQEPITFKISYQSEDGAQHARRFDLHAPATRPLLPTECSEFAITRPSLGSWSMFAGRGDEWFAAHLQSSTLEGKVRSLSPLIFTAGHALELYLKAAVTAHASLKKAMNFGHELPKLWRLCETYQGFPLKGLLQQDLLNRDKSIYRQGTRSRSSLSIAVQQHLSENEVLYLALRHLSDLKYLGLPGSTIPSGHILSFITRVPNTAIIWQLGVLAQWVWGQWCCKPGYNDSDLYRLANKLLR